jgi:hypothetical protein
MHIRKQPPVSHGYKHTTKKYIIYQSSRNELPGPNYFPLLVLQIHLNYAIWPAPVDIYPVMV